MKRAAGVLLFDADTRRYLLLERPDGTWDQPGGMLEEDESPLDAMLRELGEETGFEGHVNEWATPFVVYRKKGGRFEARRLDDPPPAKAELEYTVFHAFVERAFSPRLSDEHHQFSWVFPELLEAFRLHPGTSEAMSVALYRTR